MTSESPILDVRAEDDFLSGHLPGAVNIPLEELEDRIYELSPPAEPLSVFDSSPERARLATELLAARSRLTSIVTNPESHGEMVETGPARTRLWRPHALLIEAVQIAQSCGGGLQGHRALDIACGCGRDAVFLAEQGLHVEAWDILPDALAQCQALARRNHVEIRSCCVDLEREPIPGDIEAFDLVCCFYFLHRPLFAEIRRLVRAGGLVIYQTFVEPQGERFGKPRRTQFILRKKELAEVFADWQILSYREDLAAAEKFSASLIARRPL